MFQQCHKHGEGINSPLSACRALGPSKLGKEEKNNSPEGFVFSLSCEESRSREGEVQPRQGARTPHLAPVPPRTHWGPCPCPSLCLGMPAQGAVPVTVGDSSSGITPLPRAAKDAQLSWRALVWK